MSHSVALRLSSWPGLLLLANSVLGLDNKRKNVWRQEPAGESPCDGQHRNGIGAAGCDHLHEDELLPMEFLDFPLEHTDIDRLLGADPEDPADPHRRIHWAHFGMECDTFSVMNQGVNHRNPTTCFMGDSVKAYDANLLVHHMVAVMYLLRRRYPHIVFTLENPEATLAHHPLMTILEADVRSGGLGMRIAFLSYCVYGKEFPYKPTLLWTDSNQLYDTLMPLRPPSVLDPLYHRYPIKKCDREECDCGSFGRHGREQDRLGVRGNAHVYNTERYPDQFCNDVSCSINQEVQDRYASNAPVCIPPRTVTELLTLGHIFSAVSGALWQAQD